MMKYLNKIILLFVLTVSFIACDKNENFEIGQAQEEFQITTPSNGSVIVLSDVNLENQGLFVSWDTKENIVAPFMIEAALTGTNFETPYQLGTSEINNFTITVEALNTFLIDVMDLDPEEANSIDVRVLSNEVTTQTVSVVLTPYKVEFDTFFLVGSLTNWKSEEALEMTRLDVNIFEIKLDLTADDEFKFLPTNTSFDGDWGRDPENEGTLIIDGEGNLKGFEAGKYKITIDLNTFTYVVILYYPELYLVGDATGASWSETNNDYRMFKDAEQKGLYHYTGYFAAGAIKLREQKDSWQPQWGKGDTDGALAGNPGTQSDDPGTIPVETAGYYTFTVNIVDLSYTLEAYDASGATEYDTIGVIGSGTATGWDSDTDCTKSTFDPHIWYMNIDLTGGGEFKFRADNDWPTAWGGNQNPAAVNYGVATSNDGVNFTIPETGNYSIIFNTLTFRYSYVLNE